VRFHLGEIWRSSDGKRAVVTWLEDEHDGRRAKLFFEDGNEATVLWAELTQFGHWQVDASPRPPRRAEELETLVAKKIAQHPVCPNGMGVMVRGTGKGNWAVDSVPPPGQLIAYADCAHYTGTVAKAYGFLFALAE
jgi:hypothetical protein